MTSLSDRELVSVLFYLRECPHGEDAMSIGLSMFEAFDMGSTRFALPESGTVDLTKFSDEPRPYDLSEQDLLSLRAVLQRPGQPQAMWLSSARALRRIRQDAEPKALSSVP